MILNPMMPLLLTSEGQASLLDALPDPMKLQLPVVLFVIALVTLLFLFLKYTLFRPLSKLMDDREASIRAGQSSRSDATTQIERRQADYAAQLKQLHAQAAERRHALTTEAAHERQATLEQARQQATSQLQAAATKLNADKEAAKADLVGQIDAFSESMVQQLLKRA